MISAEASVLHALLDDDLDTAADKLREFTTSELNMFAKACRFGTNLAMNVYAEKEEIRKKSLTPQQLIMELFDRR